MRFGSIVQEYWDWRAAGNFMFGGTGSSLIFMTAAASLPESPPYILVFASLVMIGLGLCLVWMEMGRPWRFLNVFFHPQTSWMTREAGVAALLFVSALAGVMLSQPELIVLAGLAGLVFLFCQVMMLRASKGIPAWRVSAIGLLVGSTGLAEGTALLILIQSIATPVPSWLAYLLLTLVVIRTLAWQHYVARVAAAGAPKAALNALAGINWNAWIVGGALPVALILSPLVIADSGLISSSIAAALVLLTGWHIKFTIVTRAAHVQGFVLPIPQKAI